jgi:outer membrane protein assembly factor BamB
MHPRVLMLLILLALAGAALADNWPGWRGDGTGVVRGAHPPRSWSTKVNVAWRTPLPGEGNSSPIVWGDKVFLTASEDGGKTRLVLCYAVADGRELWRRAFPVAAPAKTYEKTGYAAPTPVTDGTRVYAFFDDPGLVAVDMNGTPCWTRPLGPFKAGYGMANSPVLAGDLVVQVCDADVDGFIVGVDRATGAVKWKTPRKLGAQYATPLVLPVAGKTQVVAAGGAIVGYDAATGAEVWRCRGLMPTVSPSPVAADGLVFASSGRNGPSLLVDASGQGDVTETRVRLHLSAFGPYVISPLASPGLLLPADDGVLRLVNPAGKVLAQTEPMGHFTASPIACGNDIYWTNEAGQTIVVRYIKGELMVWETNSLGEKTLASPAVADGRLYLRTNKALYCIAGTKTTPPEAALAEAVPDFATLKARYDAHQAPEGDDIPLRLGVVAGLEMCTDPQAVALLQQIALRDNHWDVSEAAVKALGAHGEAAVPALQAMFKEWRPYLKVIAAGHLARVRATAAVPTLLAAVKDGDPTVRIAVLDALAVLGGDTLPAVLAATRDKEGVVRAAAFRALAAHAASPEIAPRLLDGAADANPLVAAAAVRALAAHHVPNEVIMSDIQLYGAQRVDPVIAWLHAGPIRVKFQDGELRYLTVGDREIVRRVYFAVRDGHWDTAMPVFRRVDIEQKADSFRIRLEADCVNEVANYRWSGEIVGTPEGKITFTAGGQAEAEFRSPRIGFCLLYGAEALAGQTYELLDADGKATPGAFPKDVSPQLLATKFTGLRYTTPDGLTVTCRAGGGFGMEDQRNYCDSSYKAFHTLGYPWDVPKGQAKRDTFTLEVTGAKAAADPAPAVALAIDAAVHRLPALLPAASSVKAASFVAQNGKRDGWKNAATVAWAFNPAAHMPDDDMFFENLSSVVDQAATVRALHPTARLRVDPIHFDSPYPRPGRDPRNTGQFAAAWTAAMAGWLARAGVDEAVFTTGPAAVLELLSPLGGHAVHALVPLSGDPRAVTGFTIDNVAWVVNLTSQPQAVILPHPMVRLSRLAAGAQRFTPAAVKGATLTLAPLEVVRVGWK